MQGMDARIQNAGSWSELFFLVAGHEAVTVGDER